MRHRPPRPEPGDTQGTWTLGPDTELYDPPDEVDPYPVRSVQPGARALARVGLWGAVVIGCLGGLVGLASPGAGGEPAPTPAADDEPAGVPGPVAGLAERAVVTWLTATDRGEMRDLFVDAPGVVEGDPVTVLAADAIAGDRTGPGTWAVTVAVDVRYTVGDDEEPQDATWHAELAVVGDEAAGLRVLAAPALVPAPVGSDGWQADGDGARRLDLDDPLAVMVTGFLQAMVVGQGDPTPYLAPGVEVDPVRPAPFSSLEVGTLRATRTGEGEARVWASATGAVGRGAYAVGYQVDVVQRDGRWQVTAVTGAAAASRSGDGVDGRSGDVSPSDADDADPGGSVPVDESGGDEDLPPGDTGSDNGSDAGADGGEDAEEPVGLDDEPTTDDSISSGPGA